LKDALEADESGPSSSTSSAPLHGAQTLACSRCLSTLERLKEEGITTYLVPVVDATGTTQYLCPVCLADWA
jgi:hypothetical protein